MEVAVGAARWVVSKALDPVSDGFLEAWAASKELGINVDALKMELLYAQGMLNNTRGREIDNQALNELLQKLRDLAYNAEDVLDELDYFRIQDELEGTYEAADEHAKGCVCNLFLNAHHTAKAVGKLLWFPACSCATSPGDSREPREEDAIQQVPGCAWSCARPRSALDNTSSLPHNNQANEKVSGCMRKLASGARNTIRDVGKRLHCSSLPFVRDDDDDSSTSALCGACMRKAPQGKHAKETPKLEFDRVDLSRRMKNIVEQLQPVCAKVTAILNLELLGSTRSIAKSRPSTTSEIVEPKMYGRELRTKSIVDRITQDEYCGKDLTILPIVGPGGIGKTTLVQHIYHSQEVKNHFQVRVWNCVSQNFNVNKLIEEIKESIPRVEGEKQNATVGELIEQRLKSKRFLLILDDIWKCEYEDWKRLLVPLTKGQAKGNIILVTTRFPAVAEMVETTQSSIDLEGLDREVFWELFLACVFDDQESRNAHGGLLETGGKIAEKLKGNPLAAKTVGRLLRNHLDPNHWTRVLESREWEMQTGDHDIMPALKLSYDYLPFHLQQCFSYCALFPEDYEFNSEELIHLWIGLGLVDTSGQNKIIEDVGLSYLNDLCNHGFFKKEVKANGSHYYVIHDLLHELATKVSSYECLSIYSSNVKSIQIPPSIRHLSIITDERDVNDKMAFEDYKRDLSALDKRMKAENLRTLMLFGEYHGSFAKTFGDLFREAKALRVILLSEAYYTVEDVLHILWKSVHLRYLRITMGYREEVSLHSTISRFYHLIVLDVQQCNIDFAFPRDMSNLVKLRHFIVRDNKVHSSILEVGKLKNLQELTRFVVKKENKGFELQQIGQLVELSGSLGIYNLENVEGKEEADEAKLIHKKYLHKLILEWDINRSIKDPAREEHVLESLVPHNNLQDLCIRGHGGTNCPKWLGANLSVKSLESLYLDNVSWKNLPPLGELWVVNEHGEECQGCISGPTFLNLKRLELVKIPRLKKWVGNDTSHLFSHLEALIIQDCSELSELPFSHSTCCQSEQEANMSWFSRLRELKIVDCPKLMTLPPIPWTRAPCSAKIARAGSGFEELVYSTNYGSESSLTIKGKDGQDSMFWKVLAFHNLDELKELKMHKCPPIPRDHLQMLSSLKTLKICDSSIVLSPVEGERSHVGCTLPVDRIEIARWGAGGKELTQLLSHFPKLTELRMIGCQKITGLGVVEQQQMTATPASSPPSSANKIGEQQQQTRGEEEIAAAGVGGLLLLPPQLQVLEIYGSPELSLRTNSLDDDTAGGTGGGGGLQGLHSLRSLEIRDCPKLLSSYSSSSSGFPFPTSLEMLRLDRVEGMETLAPLSNLTSLARLVSNNWGDLRGEGLWPLLAQGNLTVLAVYETPKFFVGSEATRSHDQEILRLSSKLQKLYTDDVAGVLAAPICSLLSSSLTNLVLIRNKEVEPFTKEQEEALHLLTSLQDLQFTVCDKLQCLPAGLHRLTSLKRLHIWSCPAIRSLPKGVLPSSLQELKIGKCPAIRSLPKDGLPSSLRLLDVRVGNSEELRRQCRKLTGTIPIIRA